MAQAIMYQPLTAEVQVQSYARQWHKVALRQVLPQVRQLSPVTDISSVFCTHSFTQLPPTAYNLINLQLY